MESSSRLVQLSARINRNTDANVPRTILRIYDVSAIRSAVQYEKQMEPRSRQSRMDWTLGGLVIQRLPFIHLRQEELRSWTLCGSMMIWIMLRHTKTRRWQYMTAESSGTVISILGGRKLLGAT